MVLSLKFLVVLWLESKKEQENGIPDRKRRKETDLNIYLCVYIMTYVMCDYPNGKYNCKKSQSRYISVTETHL